MEGTSSSGSEAARRSASRQHAGSTTSTPVSPSYEERTIILAQGLQYLNHQLPERYRTPEYLQSRYRGRDRLKIWGNLEVLADGTTVYTSRRQGVRFVIRKVTTKSQFKDALETSGAHVIYGGHARYGRGPCFGETPDPGDDWEIGTNPSLNGIFRWGYPYMLIEVGEIVSHRYRVFPLKAGDTKPRREDCHPDIQRIYGTQEIRPTDRLKRFRLDEFPPGLTPLVAGSNPPVGLMGPPGPLRPSDLVWGLETRRGHGPSKIVLHAGWRDSMSSPLDLGAADMRCKVFCHFGCSSFHHNYRVLRFLREWRRTEDDRFAYWTTAPPPHVNLPSRWIYFLLTYDRQNARLNWHPSLRSALARTRQYIADSGGGYNVI